jgi:ABC-type lipoprotein export system ATPase subunit
MTSDAAGLANFATPGGVRAASGLGELYAEATSDRDSYGQGSVISCDRLVRIFRTEGVEVQALQGLDLLVQRGELAAMVGASGSGKSTLLNILAGLDRPTAGRVQVAGHDLAAMSGRERLAYRRSTVGFIWQQTSRNLLPYLTAKQNVMLPMQLAGVRRRPRSRRAADLLGVLGMADCADRTPDRLSGGEQQRAAIATALANEPEVLLADEPTGELDTATARDVFAALQTANAELGATVLIVTHDPAVSAEVRRTIAIRNGRTSSETLRHSVTDEDGNAAVSSVEYAVLDRAGRVQLPAEMLGQLRMRDRVVLRPEPDHIGVWPDPQAPDPRAPDPHAPDPRAPGPDPEGGHHG